MRSAIRGAVVLTVLLSCFTLQGARAWGDELVLNIYFCGTGATEEWYLEEEPAWHRGGGTALNKPTEQNATLYQNDESTEIQKYEIAGIVYYVKTYEGRTHYKYIANGLGTDFFSLLGAIDPDFGLRGWQAVVDEAYLALDLIADPGDGITLNLIGFSRGGIQTMKMARAVANDSRVGKINILAYDPVPGGFDVINYHGSDLKLPAKVNQFVGLYASDERTYLFDPVIPDRTELSPGSKVWLTRVPGSHETMVGNCQLDGHSLTALDPLGDIDKTHEPGMLPVYRVATVVAEQLLSSWEWGEVPIYLPSPYNDESAFLDQVDRMYDYDYWFVRTIAFLPAWSSYDRCYDGIGGRDHHLRVYWAAPVTHGRLTFDARFWHKPERAYSWCNLRLWKIKFDNEDQVYWLTKFTDPMNQTAWATLQSLRGNPPPDVTPPVPTIDPLPTISDECQVEITAPPTASDIVDGTISGTTDDPLIYTEFGTYVVTWTYTDQAGNSTAQPQQIVVQDTMAPVPDTDPLSEVTGECSAVITTTPTAADNCAGPIIGATSDPLAYYSQGDYEVVWTYDDGNGNAETQVQHMSIHDVTPPAIESLAADPAVLWPPNHKMKNVVIEVAASDNCSDPPTCQIISVSVDESEDWPGDGHTEPDWRITDTLTVQLKAERSGSGDGREYSIIVDCVDPVGNSTTGTAVVTVPHDRSR